MKKGKFLLTLAICIMVTSFFIGCAATQKSQSTGQYVDDSVITTKVKAAIVKEKSLKVYQINVETYKGIVQLSGFIRSDEEIKKAEEIAGSIEGVKEVKNNLVKR